MRWLRVAGRDLLSRAPATAAELLRRGADLSEPDQPERDTVLADLATARLYPGRSREAEAVAREVLARHHDPTVDGVVRLHLIDALGNQDRHHEAADEGLAALDRPELSAATVRGSGARPPTTCWPPGTPRRRSPPRRGLPWDSRSTGRTTARSCAVPGAPPRG